MEILNVALWWIAAAGGLSLSQIVPSIYKRNSANKAQKALKNTVFDTSKTKAIKVSQVQPHAIERAKLPVVDTITSTYIRRAEVDPVLAQRYLYLALNLESTIALPNVTIEDQHDLGVAKDSLMSSIRLLESVTTDRKVSEPVRAQIDAQLNVLEAVIQKVRDTYDDTVLREMKINTAFLEDRFTKHEDGPFKEA